MDLEKKERVFYFDIRANFHPDRHENGIAAFAHNENIIAVSHKVTKDHPFPILRIYSRRNKHCLYLFFTVPIILMTI